MRNGQAGCFETWLTGQHSTGVRRPKPQTFGGIPGLTGTSGMADLYKSCRSNYAEHG